jgi:hypothetical protein
MLTHDASAISISYFHFNDCPNIPATKDFWKIRKTRIGGTTMRMPAAFNPPQSLPQEPRKANIPCASARLPGEAVRA